MKSYRKGGSLAVKTHVTSGKEDLSIREVTKGMVPNLKIGTTVVPVLEGLFSLY